MTQKSNCIKERHSRFFVKENCMSPSWNLNQELGKKSAQGLNVPRAPVCWLGQQTKAGDLTASSREAVAVLGLWA